MHHEPQRIPLQRIFLDTDNPRHEHPLESQEEAIEWLCTNQAVMTLATDIADVGLNALELFALVPLKVPGKKVSSSFIAAEGNRRLCALKLLRDPELAPARFRAEFRRLAKKIVVPASVFAIMFESKEEADPWLERLHNGEQNGVGRVQWDADQKARHFTKNRNALALAVLDIAEKRNFITRDERRGKLTTAQRYLGNPVVREALGIAGFVGENLTRTRPAEDVDKLLQQFARDLVKGDVNSRANRNDIENYGLVLAERQDISGEKLDAVRYTGRAPRRPKPTPIEPDKATTIDYDHDIASALEELGNYKLKWLYYSLHTVPLENNVPLLSVGVWAFMETLTSVAGRVETVSFPSFISNNRLRSLGIEDKETQKAITQIVNHVSSWGNTTKHHGLAAHFNGEQLANHMKVLGPVLVGLIRAAKALDGGA